VLDTGSTIKNVQILSDKYVSKRKGELFRRVKGGTIIKLLEENNNTESIYNLVDDCRDDLPNEGESVMTGMTNKTVGTIVTAITYNTEILNNMVYIYKIRL
jgi:hypothetical protein